MSDQWLTIQEASTLMRVSRRTIYNWYHLGRLTTRRTVGESLRILESSLWKDESAAAASSPPSASSQPAPR